MLNFTFTNNEAKYKALILGIILTKEMRVKKLTVKSDFDLIIRQMNKEHGVKEPAFATYNDVV